MKLTHRNDKAAKAVLKQVEKLFAEVPDTGSNWFSVDVYANCREQGFSISDFARDRRVSFSEHRSSDNIVVYTGNRNDFAFNTNIPSDEVWRNSTHFKYNEAEKAAAFIFNFLTQETE